MTITQFPRRPIRGVTEVVESMIDLIKKTKLINVAAINDFKNQL